MQIHIAAGATVHINGVRPADIPGELIQLPVRTCSCSSIAAVSTQDTPAFGELWPGQGGYYAGILPAIGDRPAQHMIVSAQEAERLTWGPYTDIEGARSRHDGRANTAALVQDGGKDFAKNFPAAWWCYDLQVGPLEDFHMPSQAELFLASLYAPQLFKKEGWYWSSTQGSRNDAFVQDFESGCSLWYDLDFGCRVRAFRWIPLTA
jgi:hypothetical protein